MDIVADTNIFLAVVLNEPEKKGIVRLTLDSCISAPEILPYEIANALSAMVKRHRLSDKEALKAEESAGKIAVKLTGVEIQASLQIAVKYNIYAYDAYFLQCAYALNRPLLTLDQRMLQVASELGIRTLEI